MADLHLPDPNVVDADDIAPAIAQLAALQSALAARLILERKAPAAAEEDVLLSAKEAAALLNVKRNFLYRRAKTLPFTKHLSRRSLRFSKRGLMAWLAKKR